MHDAGSVRTGWSQAERTRLAALLQAAAADICPFTQIPPPVAGVRWVLPQLVGEVRSPPAPAPDASATPPRTGYATTSPPTT
ncbi:hypothetical protein ACFVAG_25775 [Streptomyces sp. NPDC057644]|uniref:ATP dependent DNA ligase n=1 Tax=Streptomyces sp. NPDC057644 TaxID=3346191 RepID=UPI0036B5940B